MPKIIAVIPVFNEEKTLGSILKRIAAQADLLVCVNDGSKDRSASILRDFGRKRKNFFVVDLPENRGMAGALKQGLLFVLYLAQKGRIKDSDIVVTIDADGQHQPEYIARIIPYMIRQKADIILTRRDFSVYPLYKVWGNRFLTWTNSILAGFKYEDVESGLRFLKVFTLPGILKYYTGVKYSCAQEIALISARSGYKIDNRFLVKIAYYRAGTTLGDGFIVLGLSVWTYLRWLLKIGAAPHADLSLMEKSYRSSPGAGLSRSKA